MIADPLKSAALQLRDWAISQAFPYWATSGFDREHGRFEERLSLQGERMTDVPIRLMAQARQIYTYGLAARKKWYRDALPLVEEAYASMIRDFHRRDGRDGWIYSIRRDGTIADARRDFYAHAFVLRAIAAYMEVTGRREVLLLADETLAYLDRHLRAEEGGGYVDSAPPVDQLRRQNPHMHLLEGVLALWSSSGDARYLARAGEIFGLFSSRFFRQPGILGEYFDAVLDPADGVIGTIVEPGHHYEWIWLLRWLERACGRTVQPHVDALFHHADANGYDNAGLIVDEVLIDGSHRTRSRRVWPVTEAIKANLVEASLGRANCDSKAAALAVLLRNHFLTPATKGGWIDRLDENGGFATAFMPSSTFYHIAGALDELEQFAK